MLEAKCVQCDLSKSVSCVVDMRQFGAQRLRQMLMRPSNKAFYDLNVPEQKYEVKKKKENICAAKGQV